VGVQRDALRHQRCCGGSRHGRAVDWPGESEPTGRARSAATVASPLTGSRFVRQTSRTPLPPNGALRKLKREVTEG